ncbi:MAG: DUF488 domain-containing protein [Selenomonadaceae bacterium]|nr:DUF488 domain-containing protein [Selenomonadaceae bacterium]
MKKIFTIGSSRKTAEEFFRLLEDNGVTKIIDVRLNNTSQILAFAKYPDIEFFTRKILGAKYFHDRKFTPSEKILVRYKKNQIDWDDYEKEFAELMNYRDIDTYIADKYSTQENYCLLCSEPTPEYCHRRLVAEKIKAVLEDVEIVHL